MILTCPACATRYRVSEEELAAPAGRIVRCANCGEVWQQAPSAAEMRGDQVMSITRSPQAEPVLDAPSRSFSAPRDDILPRPQPPLPTTTERWRPARAALGLATAAILVLAALAIAAGMVARSHLAAIGSPAGRLSAVIALPSEPDGYGLAIEKIAPVRTAEGLMIDGEIANPGSAAREVPRLRVALQDAADKELQFEVVDPPKARLQPGEIAHFSTPFAHPADAAARVAVTFASH